MKKAAKDIKPGDEVKLARGKTGTVRSITVVELPVQRTVETAIITLVDEGDDDDPKFTDLHVRANKKMDVTPPSKWDQFKAMFKMNKPKEENEEKLAEKAKPTVPFFVKKPSS